jgi:glycosyltransferase involved in cell wall biosynthesis
MRILLVTGLAGPGSIAGGVWTAVLAQAEGLRSQGHAVKILGGWMGPLPNATVPDTTLVRVRQPVPGGGLRGLVSTGWSAQCHALAHWADVAHISLCRDLLTNHAVGILHRRHVPVVIQTHGMVAPSPSGRVHLYDEAILRRSFRRASHVIALSDTEKRSLEHFVSPTREISIVANGIPNADIRWRGGKHFLFAGRLHSHKRPHVALKAVLNLVAQGYDVGLAIAGPDHGELANLKSLVRAGSHHDRVTFLGSCSRDDVLELMASSMATIVPSESESFGLSIVEALSVAAPCILTTNTPIAAVIENAGGGLVRPPTVLDFTEGLITLVSSESSQLQQMGRIGRHLQQTLWSVDTMVGHLIEAYAAAMASGRANV